MHVRVCAIGTWKRIKNMNNKLEIKSVPIKAIWVYGLMYKFVRKKATVNESSDAIAVR